MPNLLYQDKQKRRIRIKEEIKFSSFSSYHLIKISARTKSEKQVSEEATDDEELIVKIDGKTFPKLGSKEALLDSPASFNGGKLHDLAKTVYFLTFLKGKNHTISLKTDEPHNIATLENLKIYTLNLFEETLALEINQQAEDGDRRPWITFALDNLSLKSATPTITYSRRERDSDDVKVIIDGKTQGNLLRNIKHFLWRYVGSLIPQFSSKTETETFSINLPQVLHYLEFWADRMPTLHKLTIEFGVKPPVPPGIPTVDNPKWTGDFYDDTEDVFMARMILGEAERQPKETKMGVGFTVLNRLKKQNPDWGYNVREIILKENQYDGMWNENTYDKVRDPLKNTSELRKQEWEESHQVAVGILSGNLKDLTSGATHFHSYSEEEKERFPSWATEKNFKIKIGNISFYELER